MTPAAAGSEVVLSLCARGRLHVIKLLLGNATKMSKVMGDA